MTTFADARAELEAAFAGVGNGATSAIGGMAPPFVFIAGDGVDMAQLLRGACASTWRIILAAGVWELDTAADELDAMKQEAIPILRGLAGWQVESLTRDGERVFGDLRLLSAELRGVRMIDL